MKNQHFRRHNKKNNEEIPGGPGGPGLGGPGGPGLYGPGGPKIH